MICFIVKYVCSHIQKIIVGSILYLPLYYQQKIYKCFDHPFVKNMVTYLKLLKRQKKRSRVINMS